MEATRKIPVVIYAESTPNPSAMKFVANKLLLQDPAPVEFNSAADAHPSPLAAELFRFPFIKGVFISGNYITLFKTDAVAWEEIVLQLREFLKEYLSAGKAVLTAPVRKAEDHAPLASAPEQSTVDHAIPSSDVEKKIVEVLEQYVSPAVQQDGGMIVFRSFSEGVVSLMMRGACSGCPSSTITLKSGIEAILKRFVPEVKEVVSINA